MLPSPLSCTVAPEMTVCFGPALAMGGSTGLTVTVNPVLPPIANAGPKQTVISGATVRLNGLGSTDPQNLPLTYLWKTGGPISNFSSTTSPTPTFTAPTLKAGSGPTSFTEGLTVNNGYLTSASQSNVTIVVVSGADTLAAVNVIYRLSQQRLTVDVSSTLNGTASDGSWQLFLQGLGPGGTPIQMVYSPALGAGVYEAVVNGIPQPASVTVTSSLGATATFPVAVR